ncbi:class I SAM-dependent methyltransferase [bacterium]|nr:class I SAM-dependent methyltransferase [bacterium]
MEYIEKSMNNASQGEWWADYFDKVYRDLYAPFLTDERTEREVQFILSYAEKVHAKRILDIACGDGRHAWALQKRGYEVTGIDSSRDMIAAANEKFYSEKNRPVFLREDARYFSLPEKFPLATMLFTAFGYSEDRKDDVRILKNIRKHMEDGGIFILDLRSPFSFPSEKFSAGKVVEENSEKQTFDEKTGTWMIEREMGGEVRIARVHIFSQEEITQLLEQSGFVVEEIKGSYRRDSFTESTNRMIIVACAKKRLIFDKIEAAI